MADLGRERLRVRALELLGRSFEVFLAGDHEVSDRFAEQAVEECGADVVDAIRAGMVNGEIPMPDGQAWAEYVAGCQARLLGVKEGGRADD